MGKASALPPPAVTALSEEEWLSARTFVALVILRKNEEVAEGTGFGRIYWRDLRKEAGDDSPDKWMTYKTIVCPPGARYTKWLRCIEVVCPDAGGVTEQWQALVESYLRAEGEAERQKLHGLMWQYGPAFQRCVEKVSWIEARDRHHIEVCMEQARG